MKQSQRFYLWTSIKGVAFEIHQIPGGLDSRNLQMPPKSQPWKVEGSP